MMRRSVGKSDGLSEEEIQRTVFRHLRQRGTPGLVAFHPRNGSKDMQGRRAGINVGLGVLAGIPDVIMLLPPGQLYALELKTVTGRLGDEQRKVMRALSEAGAICGTTHGLDEALRWLERHGLVIGTASQGKIYDGSDDFGRSLEVAYEAVKQRKAAGGAGWTPK